MSRSIKLIAAVASALALVPAGDALADVTVFKSGSTLHVIGRSTADHIDLKNHSACNAVFLGEDHCEFVVDADSHIHFPEDSGCAYDLPDTTVAHCKYSTRVTNLADVKLKGGADTVTVGYDTRDEPESWRFKLDYGSGADTVDVSNIKLVAGFSSPEHFVNPDQRTRLEVLGGTGADEFTGTLNDWTDVTLRGQAGSDRMSVASRIFAGDRMVHEFNGGNGADTISLGDGGQSCGIPVVVQGAAGNDKITGSACSDDLRGGSGSDDIVGGLDDDTISGGAGDDVLAAATSVTQLGDVETTNTGTEHLSGGGGADMVVGSNGRDDLHGGAGNDTLVAGEDPDTLAGDGGDDVLLSVVDGTHDAIDGGAGKDTFRYSPLPITRSVTIDLRNEVQSTDGDTFAGIDKVVTGSGNDHLFGTGADEQFLAGDGQDTVDAGGGDDVIDVDDSTAGTGNELDDTVRAGAGADTVRADDGRRDDIQCGSSAHQSITGTAIDVDVAQLDSLDGSPEDCNDATPVGSSRPGPGQP